MLMKRRTVIVLIVAALLAIAVLAGILLRNARAASEPEKPASAGQVAEEFEEELGGEEVDPDSFSDYVEDYVVDYQEDENAVIN